MELGEITGEKKEKHRITAVACNCPCIETEIILFMTAGGMGCKISLVQITLP